MSLSYHIQRSFAGGEISPRMLMRQDHEYYQSSALSMINYIPTPQGSAVRAPGTRYLQEVATDQVYSWDYTGDGVGNAAAGELVYDSVADPDEFRISYTDDDGVDRTGFLAALESGDTFTFGTWTVTVAAAVTDDAVNSQYVVPVTVTGTAPAVGVTTLTVSEAVKQARIIPYLTSGNERSLLLLTPRNIKLLANVTDRLEEDGLGLSGDPGTGVVTYRKQIIENPSFRQGIEPWTIFPAEYTGKNGDGPLGVFLDEDRNLIRMVPRLYKFPAQEEDTCTLETSCTVDTATDRITLDYWVDYVDNPSQGAGGFTFNVLVSPNADYSTPIYDETFTEVDYPVAGGSFNPGLVNADLPAAGWTGDLYIKLTAVARSTADRDYSNPIFNVRHVNMWANGEAELTEADLETPYLASDLPDLHFVQSPYEDKELVITHPRHPPYRFKFNTGGGAYVFEAVPFTNAPSAWSVNNYPATCTSAGGRLVLAGGQTFKVASGDPVAGVSETVWATEVGSWAAFTASPGSGATNESLEINTIYRSPIQWTYGQKSLLVGALEMEYVISATDNILAPDNLAANMHSTHGSNNVQPAGFGTGVIFPSDGGTRARKMSFLDEQNGWVAQDLTLYNPEICFPKIKRMVRLRNPHQMCMVLTQKGQLSIFHSESGLEGWSRYKINGGNIRDICVVQDEEGRDVPFLLVTRTFDGTKRIYLEAIPNFAFDEEWSYVDCHLTYNFETPTDTLTGLEHLEGQRVLVADRYRYLGTFLVTNGEVVIEAGYDNQTTTVTNAIVGLRHRSSIKTLPPQKLDPGSMASFKRFCVRVLGSTRPIINGERVKDRDPLTPLNLTQGPDYLADWHVPVMGFDAYQSIQIEEFMPFRNEVLGIYGKLEANSP